MFNLQNPAYTISNEDLRSQIAQLSDRPQHDVLTVAASGDQALFYQLAGAKHIVTFDITENARLIQEIKYAALPVLNRQEYTELLYSLYSGHDAFRAQHMSRILPRLSPEATEILTRNNSCLTFKGGLSVHDYPDHLPTISEYEKLVATIGKTPTFIHSPLNDLHTKISNQYDIINISNIFDFCDANSQLSVLKNLGKNLKIGGRIVYPAQLPRYKYDKVRCSNPQTGTVVEYEKKLANHLIVFQRTR